LGEEREVTSFFPKKKINENCERRVSLLMRV